MLRLRAVKVINKDDLADNFGGLFKKDGYEKARADLESARLARDRRDFEELRTTYERHIREVLQRCLKHTGGDYAEWADVVKSFADAGARQADKKEPELHESLKEPQKKIWRLFYVAARQHDGFRVTKAERDACDACSVDVPSDELLKFEKKWGPPVWLRDLDEQTGARMAKDLEIQEEMRDAMEDKDEKSSWEKMIKVREKMGKGPPVIIPYESKERTQKIISQFSGNDHAMVGPPGEDGWPNED